MSCYYQNVSSRERTGISIKSSDVASMAQSLSTDLPSLSITRNGTRFHSMEAEAVSAVENHGFTVEGGWKSISINSQYVAPGDQKVRPDFVHVHEATKRLLIEDTYTGARHEWGHESMTHHLKGLHYIKILKRSGDDRILKYLNQGYTIDYCSANPRKAH